MYAGWNGVSIFVWFLLMFVDYGGVYVFHVGLLFMVLRFALKYVV